jgi:hypothetical protein
MAVRTYDLVGKRFNKLVVLECLGRRNNRVYWKCLCDCGQISEVSTSNLPRTKSCGCLKIAVLFERNKKLRKRPYEALYNQLLRVGKKGCHAVELTYEDFIKFTKFKTCIYCKNELQWSEYDIRKWGQRYNLDRKDTLKGYSLDNCVPCCKTCNAMKSKHFSYEAMLCLGNALRQIREQKL